MEANNIIVLGANSDIGSVLVRVAALEIEAQILAVSRSPKPTDITDPPNVERLVGLDLTREEDLLTLASAASDKFQNSFAVIHSVGNFWIHKPLIETCMTEIREMIENQVLTLFGAAHVLTPVMIRNNCSILAW